MSWGDTKSPLKPKKWAKYQLPKRRGKGGQMEYYFTPELEEEFRRRYPTTLNDRMMLLFGIAHATLERFKRKMGLEKNKEVIRKKQVKRIVNTCKKNGYYDSLKGKRPSEANIEGTRKKRALGFHPLTALKETDPRKYKRLMKRRSEKRKALIAKERKHVMWGISQRTNLHLPSEVYTKRQTAHRYSALNRGYLLGSKREFSGERYVIYYDEYTVRSPKFEKNCIADGFTILPCNKTITVLPNVM